MFARKQDSDQLIDQKKHKWVALYIKHGYKRNEPTTQKCRWKKKKVDR